MNVPAGPPSSWPCGPPGTHGPTGFRSGNSDLPKVRSAPDRARSLDISRFWLVIWRVLPMIEDRLFSLREEKGGTLTASESSDVEGAMQVSIQTAGAAPADRLVRNPGRPAPLRPSPGRMGARPPGGCALWHPPRRFKIGPGPVARWQTQSCQPPGGATAGEAGPPGYARHPDYLVAENPRTARKPFPARRSEV